MSENLAQIVLVTGANGFVAGHVIKELLDKNYQVVGSVRNHDIGHSITQLFDNHRFTYEIAHLKDIGSFSQILKKHRVTKVVHTAAPYDFHIDDFESEVIQATLQGTNNLLTSIKEDGDLVSHIVNISNLMAHYTLEQYSNPLLVLNESSWCSYTYEEGKRNPFTACHYSKVAAERIFWDFINKYKNRFVGTSISPAFVFGPQPFHQYLCKSRLNTSSRLIQSLLQSKTLDDIPNLYGYVSDVRDIAHIIVKSLDDEKLYFKRLAPFSGIFSLHYILNFTRRTFPKQAKNLPPYATIDVVLFSFDNSDTLNALDFELTGVDQTIYDTVAQMLNTT